MLIERLDRTQWRLPEAVEYIGRRIEITFPAEPVSPEGKDFIATPWLRPKDPREVARDQARQEMLIALRDGDLHATGRLSTERQAPWELDSLWPLHSGHHSTIAPEHWRGGQLDWQRGTLTGADTQFIDIRVPRFAVVAIWPERKEMPTAGADGYRTPYLDLLERAIAEWRITEERQPKKDNLLDWFLEQTVVGEPLSDRLADAMATLVRMPASQRGGAKRMGG